MEPFEMREYVSSDGHSPFGVWFSEREARAAAKVTVVVARIAQGNFSDVKAVGAGVLERRIDYGFRLCFGKDGGRIVILLAGGTKRRQQADIERAQARWRDYGDRKT